MMSEPGHSPPNAEILYGVAGWSYADWEGIVYPKNADSETKLISVAAACDLIEVNTTFYRTPRPQMTDAWARRLTRAGLQTRLVVKVGKAFTHDEQYSADDLREFKLALSPLDANPVVDRNGIEQPRLLGLLIQFPIFFRLTPENTQRIERLAEDLSDWTRILELRHPSWARPSAYHWLKKLGMNLANIDVPAGGAEGPGEKAAADGGAYLFPREAATTGPIGYFRLHGRNNKAWFDRNAGVEQKYNYLYSPGELQQLSRRVRELAGQAKTVAVVGNNHFRGKALATVLNLANLVEGRRSRAPAPLIAEYPQLAEFTDPADPPPAPEPEKPPRKAAKKPKAEPPPKNDDPDQLTLF
ncbi:MAG: DUF72 domain-containing protein [Phycisphaerae bacterium]|nr:DUF72 domain-containing protein [Phycisphaerae bacterium]